MSKKGKKWSDSGDGIQVLDVVFEVRELDRMKITEGKDSDKYNKQHNKTVKLINQYNSQVPSRQGFFNLSISKTRHLIQTGTKEGKDSEVLNG
jgi:hypothetical protein